MDNIIGENSKELFAKACTYIPGGVNSPVRACRNVDSQPLFIRRGLGSHIWDVDEREYIDYVLSWGPLLLGHCPFYVIEGVKAAAERGTTFGAPSPFEVGLAERVLKAMPGLEMIRMVNSGTEASMSALRLARGFTKRDKILKFVGCYHGHVDSLLVKAGSGVATLAIPGTPGIPAAVVADTLTVQYNDFEAVQKCFEEYGEQIAAVIVEPVAANMGLVLPKEGFLAHLRKLTQDYGALLIFDEVITGFRVAYGGAQSRWKIDPDLTILGKIIGGGLPVGAFGGKRTIMQHIAPEGEIYQAGTLSGNPVAMVAGSETVSELKIQNYENLERRVSAFAHNLHDILADKNVPVQVPTIASMFCVFFSPTPVTNFAETSNCNQDLFKTFYKQMLQQQIYLPPSAFETCMVSFAHTDEDFERTLDAARKVRF